MREFIEQNAACIWLRFFMIKQIFKRYGKEVMLSLRQKATFKWIIPEDLASNAVDNIEDHFVMCGGEYTRIRSALSECFLTFNFESLFKANQMTAKNVDLFFLAVYKNITLVPHLVERERDKCHKLLEHLMSAGRCVAELKPSFEALFDHAKLPVEFNSNANACLLIMHVYIMLKANKATILKPLSELVEQPEAFVKAFLPSLPHDEDFEKYKELIKATKETHKFHTCPNGHF